MLDPSWTPQKGYSHAAALMAGRKVRLEPPTRLRIHVVSTSGDSKNVSLNIDPSKTGSWHVAEAVRLANELWSGEWAYGGGFVAS